MNKLQEYLKRKEILAKGYPKIYIVESSPKGVVPITREVVDIVENVGIRQQNGVKSSINRYVLDDKDYPFYPFHVDFVEGENTSIESGNGSGFGDLWCWSYYSTFSKDDADAYYEKELERVTKKYKI